MFRKLVYLAAALHLGLVFLTVVHGIDNHTYYRYLERPLACLTAFNYSAWRFAFFTPDVGKSTELEIVLEGPHGRSRRYNTSDGFAFFTANAESENRFYGFKVHAAKDSTYQDLSSLSFCTRMLNLHRDMHRITYRMKGIKYPDMKVYREEGRVDSALFYETRFSLY